MEREQLFDIKEILKKIDKIDKKMAALYLEIQQEQPYIKRIEQMESNIRYLEVLLIVVPLSIFALNIIILKILC